MNENIDIMDDILSLASLNKKRTGKHGNEDKKARVVQETFNDSCKTGMPTLM